MGIGEFIGSMINIKFIILFIIFGILPVWVFTLVELGFFMKVGFSGAAALGIYMALQGKSMRKRR